MAASEHPDRKPPNALQFQRDGQRGEGERGGLEQGQQGQQSNQGQKGERERDEGRQGGPQGIWEGDPSRRPGNAPPMQGLRVDQPYKSQLQTLGQTMFGVRQDGPFMERLPLPRGSRRRRCGSPGPTGSCSDVEGKEGCKQRRAMHSLPRHPMAMLEMRCTINKSTSKKVRSVGMPSKAERPRQHPPPHHNPKA